MLCKHGGLILINEYKHEDIWGLQMSKSGCLAQSCLFVLIHEFAETAADNTREAAKTNPSSVCYQDEHIALIIPVDSIESMRCDA